MSPAPDSSTSPVFSAFAQLLEEERAAIRALDGSKLDRIAEQKVSLMDRLSDLGQADRLASAGPLKELVAELRHNGVLLVHARGIIRDVLRIKGAQIEAPAIARPGFGSIGLASDTPIRPRLSVRG